VEASDENVDEHADGQLIGLLAVFASCFTSGFAGVYFEKMLQSTQSPCTCAQHAASHGSILLGLVPVFLNDFDSIPKWILFRDTTKLSLVSLCARPLDLL
jgi:hypothetical protein